MDRPAGVAALAVFFFTAAIVAAVCGFALLFPGSFLEPIWRLNPSAQEGFARLGNWSALGMAAVALACTVSGAGLWLGRCRGYFLAAGILAVNLVGDLVNGLWRDARALAGAPIAAVMLLYLRSERVRAFLAPGPPPDRAASEHPVVSLFEVGCGEAR